MLSTSLLTRRSFARGLGAAFGMGALARPFVSRTFAANAAPKRLVIITCPNGVDLPNWACTGSGRAFTFGPNLQALAPFRDKAVALQGLEVVSAESPFIDRGHFSGWFNLYTGKQYNCRNKPADGDCNQFTVNGPSVDAFLADQIARDNPDLPFKSLNMGGMSYTFDANGSDVASEADPAKIYGRIARLIDGRPSGDGAADAAAQRALADKRSVLDGLVRQAKLLNQTLDASGRARLEAVMTNVRAVEKRLSSSPVLGGAAACKAPEAPRAMALNDPMNLESLVRARADLLAVALACDLTRVSSFSIGSLAWDIVGTHLGHTRSYHVTAHDAESAARTKVIGEWDRWMAAQVAYLLKALDDIPEGDGSVLDHSLVLWGNEQSDGAGHRWENMPYLLFGSAGGAVDTGQLIRTAPSTVTPKTPQKDGWPHNDLLISLCHAMGYPVATFGAPALCKGPLPGLLKSA